MLYNASPSRSSTCVHQIASFKMDLGACALGADATPKRAFLTEDQGSPVGILMTAFLNANVRLKSKFEDHPLSQAELQCSCRHSFLRTSALDTGAFSKPRL